MCVLFLIPKGHLLIATELALLVLACLCLNTKSCMPCALPCHETSCVSATLTSHERTVFSNLTLLEATLSQR